MGWAVSSSRCRPMKPTVAVGSRARAPSSMPSPARRTGTRQTGPEISSTPVSVSGVLMRTCFVGMFPVASATMMRASSFMACLKSGVFVRSSRRTASLWRLKGPSTTCRFFASWVVSLIERVRLSQGRNPILQALSFTAGRRHDDLGDFAHLVLAHAAGRHGRRAEADTAGYCGRFGIIGHHVLVAGDADRFKRIFQFLARDTRIYEVDQDQVVVRPTGYEVQTTVDKALG